MGPRGPRWHDTADQGRRRAPGTSLSSLIPARVIMVTTTHRRLIVGMLVAGLVAAGLVAASLNDTRWFSLTLPRSAAGTVAWPDGQELPTFSRPAAPLAYVDLTTASNDDKALVASLQGVVNRRQPRLYVTDGAAEGNTTWLDSLHLAYKRTTVAAVLHAYARLAAGIVVWDPSQPDTLNLATTIAGLSGGLVASPAQVALLTAPPYRLRIVQDLRGRFVSRLEIYRYAYLTLWRRTTHRALVGLNPATQYDVLRDYAVANGLMVIYLDPSNPTEAALYDQFVASMPVDGAYLGWFPNDVTGEVAGTTINSQHGVMTFASDYFQNMTVLAGTGRSIAAPPAAPALPHLGNKIYVAFNVSDGDNLQENEHRMRLMWDDRNRGRVPLSWTISPGLVDAAPGILRWYWRTATRNDELVAGVSGLGYVRPDQVPCGLYAAFARRTSIYLHVAGLRVIHLLDSGNTLPACAARAYGDDVASLLGLLQTVSGSQAPALLGGRHAPLPYVTMDGFQTSAGALVSAVQRAAAGWDGRSPRFIAVIGVAWDMMPGDFLSAMNTLAGQSASYVFVRDDQLMTLIRHASAPRRHRSQAHAQSTART